MAWRQNLGGSEQHLTRAAAAARTRTQRPGKHLAVRASELVIKPDFQILRRYRRSLLLRLEHTHRPTLEDYVHRPTRLGDRRLLILRIVAVATSLRCAAVSRTPDSTKHSADGQAIDSKLGHCRSRRPSLPEPSRRNSGR